MFFWWGKGLVLLVIFQVIGNSQANPSIRDGANDKPTGTGQGQPLSPKRSPLVGYGIQPARGPVHFPAKEKSDEELNPKIQLKRLKKMMTTLVKWEAVLFLKYVDDQTSEDERRTILQKVKKITTFLVDSAKFQK